jgi:pSer/pThr/pTyr-binding forkhead associated (FHA) protein
MSVRVAVRVRPFNQREKDLGAVVCLEMNSGTTVIIDTKTESRRDFSFDYSFWSHDGFIEREDGYLVPASPQYADQQHVYGQLGEDVLNNAWEGYNCCLFAYGQTGAGKSYSMMGYGVNKGIVPISAEEIFKRIERNANPQLLYEVTMSMLEIYNERVQDLLIPVATRPAGGLKIRESKALGVFVDNLSKHPVSSFAEIEYYMDMGNTHRSIGATQMNATSSRAHTIMTIELRQLEQVGDRKMEKFSVINLVDLAGSEKTGQTGATGERLKEGCAINKSLVVLGTVIETLADRASGKKPNVVIPYRESALTRILSNALGGNSKTIMVCALSPASSNYEETLSTLRYADRAKKIKNQAVVNESVQDRIIRELREENEQLKKLLDQSGGGGLDKIREISEQLAANESLVEQQSKSWSELRQQSMEQHLALDYDVPHLVNLNEDPQLSGKVYYNFKSIPLTVGRRETDPDIVLGGVGIEKRHCEFDIDDEERVTLRPLSDRASQNLFVNGQQVTGVRVLQHSDRIFIGTNTVFLFKTSSEVGSHIDFESAMQERLNTENSAKEEAMLRIQEEAEERIKALKAEYEQQLSRLQQPAEAAKRIQEVEDQAQSKRVLQTRLARCFPLTNEANLIASESNRACKFTAKVFNVLPDEVTSEDDLVPEQWDKELMVEVVSQDYGFIWHWTLEKFEDRLCLMRDLLEEYRQDTRPEVNPEDDPYWDPPQEHLIGKAYYLLKPLSLLFDNPATLHIISSSGGEAGSLRMNIVPVTPEDIPMDDGPETPEELIGSSINFRVEIEEVTGIPLSHANNVYCAYDLGALGMRSTATCHGYNEHPVFNYSEIFREVQVDRLLCDFLQTKILGIRVYGVGMASRIERPAPKQTRPVQESVPVLAPVGVKQAEPAKGRPQETRGKGASAKPPTASSKPEKKKDCRVF